MMLSLRVPIGSFLERIRRPVEIETGKEYQLVTIRLHHKGVVERTKKHGSEIGTKKMYRVRTGDFILSGIDARNGAFGIVPKELDGAVVTNDFWYFKVDEDVIDKRLFLELTSTGWFDDICRRVSDGTTQRIRLQKEKFFNQTIALPPQNKQPALLHRLLSVKKTLEGLEKERDLQKQLLTKLRQAILKEAIEGKLTADWRKVHPDVEPASELFKKLEQKKVKLLSQEMAAGNAEAKLQIRKTEKLNSGRHNPPSENIPDTWVWRTVLGVALKVVDCHNKTAPYSTNGIPIIRTSDIKKGILSLSKCKYVTKEAYDRWSRRCIPKTADILITREAPIGDAAIIPPNTLICMGQRTMLIRPMHEYINKQYLLYSILASSFLERLNRIKKGAFVGHLRVGDVERAWLPVPPFEEQQLLVERLQVKFASCNKLEAEISASEKHAKHLSIAVLQEVFDEK